MVIGVVLPLILFSLPAVRKSRGWLFGSALMVITGLVLNRFNVSMLALNMRPGYIYYPSLGEIAISLGLVIAALLVFQIAMRVLPMGHTEMEESLEHKEIDAGEAVEPEASQA
jgi:Ni/Fe-hydrogenase subunit HybB-like protein